MKKRKLIASDQALQRITYQEMVMKTKPKPTLVRNLVGAFVFGGSICAFGQALFNFFLSLGLARTEAGAATSAALIFLAALLTGLGIYDSLAKYAGAGTIVPITGFANSMVAPALEYRREGLVFGVGQRMFTLAGPVLAFGFVASWLVGLAAYLIR